MNIFRVTSVLAGSFKDSGGASTPATAYGSLMHEALEYYIANAKPPEEAYTKVAKLKNVTLVQFKSDFINVVTILAETFGRDFLSKNIITLEKRLIKDYGDFCITGQPDMLLECKETGKKTIVDYKTDSNVFKSLEKHKTQLACYCDLTGAETGVLINTKFHQAIRITGIDLKIYKQKFNMKLEKHYKKYLELKEKINEN